jgi:Uma2 family endonuclease
MRPLKDLPHLADEPDRSTNRIDRPESEDWQDEDWQDENWQDNVADCGWRMEELVLPDGSLDYTYRPLTELEFLHPCEGDRLPSSTLHDQVAGDLKEILSRRYAQDPTVGVFRDILVCWDLPDLGDHCPDTFVVFGLQNRDVVRTRFTVADEGVRPALVVEVVSPRFREADRKTKVSHYAIAGVQEYLICDRRSVRKQLIEEVLGYRLREPGLYEPIAPDDQGRVLFQTVGLWISLQAGQIRVEDATTGARLLTPIELEAAKQQAEQQTAEMAALLARYRQQFGEIED